MSHYKLGDVDKARTLLAEFKSNAEGLGSGDQAFLEEAVALIEK